jgi:hypothetical protein
MTMRDFGRPDFFMTLLCSVAAVLCLYAPEARAEHASADTVHVTPPAGVKDTDRASIIDALEGTKTWSRAWTRPAPCSIRNGKSGVDGEQEPVPSDPGNPS